VRNRWCSIIALDPFDPIRRPNGSRRTFVSGVSAFVITFWTRIGGGKFLMWWATALPRCNGDTSVLAKELHLGSGRSAGRQGGWRLSYRHFIHGSDVHKFSGDCGVVFDGEMLCSWTVAIAMAAMGRVWAAILLLQPAAVLVLVFCVALVHFQSGARRQKIGWSCCGAAGSALDGENLLVFHKLFLFATILNGDGGFEPIVRDRAIRHQRCRRLLCLNASQ